MLRNDRRRRLSEHNWPDIKKKDHNPSQTLNRIGKQANDALGDLALLAEKLPEDNLRKIFTLKNLRVLLDSILYGEDVMHFVDDEELDVDIDYNIRRAQLAALMARTGINFCIEQYASIIEQNSTLNEPIIEQLRKASLTCDEIVTKMYMSQIQKTAQKENLIYLFDGAKIINTYEKRMDEIRNENVKKFVEFCNEQLGVAGLSTSRIQEISGNITTDGVEEINFHLVNEYGTHIVGSLAMSTRAVIDTATLSDDEGKSIIDLVLRKENDGLQIFKKEDSN